MQARLVATVGTRDELGEGVQWRDSDHSVWWTDIHGRRLHRLSWPGRELRTFATPERLCSFGFIDGDDDWLIAAFESGFALFAPAIGELRWLAKPGELAGDIRLNDGRVDCRGRFWAGSMGEPPSSADPRGVLYRLDPEQGLSQWLDGVGISNGLCWSPDGKRMYFADTLAGTVSRAEVDAAGDPGPFFPWARIGAGAPDGAVTDAAGRYWCAIWGGARVEVLDADGSRLHCVAVPTPQPTCVAFGGPGHSLLFVSSAAEGLDAAALASDPAPGSLFVFETEARGLPAARASADYLSMATTEDR